MDTIVSCHSLLHMFITYDYKHSLLHMIIKLLHHSRKSVTLGYKDILLPRWKVLSILSNGHLHYLLDFTFLRVLLQYAQADFWATPSKLDLSHFKSASPLCHTLS